MVTNETFYQLEKYGKYLFIHMKRKIKLEQSDKMATFSLTCKMIYFVKISFS